MISHFLPRMNHSQTHSWVGITKHEFNLGISFHQANCDIPSLSETLALGLSGSKWLKMLESENLRKNILKGPWLIYIYIPDNV